MYKINNNDNTRAETLLTYATYGIICLILLTLFIENFIFSSGFDLLRFRETDDVAFQVSLRHLHLAIEMGQFKQLAVMNDYAYGWIYWFPLALITYPLYWMSSHFAIDWPLIVAPRQLSLAFGIMTLFVVRKILKKYQTPEWAIAIALLSLSLFRTFGYFSLRFATVNEVMFFAVLSFYLAIAEDSSTPKNRRQIATALALAGAVKLSGLLIAPLIFVLAAVRYNYKSKMILARDLFLTTITFLLLLTFFSNPALYDSIFHPQIAKTYFQALTHILQITRLSNDSESPITRFYNMFFDSIPNLIFISLLFFGLIMRSIKRGLARWDFFAIVVTLALGSLYLSCTATLGIGAAYYATSISFLLVLGITWWSSFRNSGFILVAIVLLQFGDLGQRTWLQYYISTTNNVLAWHHLSYYISALKSKEKVDEANRIANCMHVTDKTWGGHVFIDFTVTTSFNPLSYPKACTSIAWNNLSVNGKYCNLPIDYIILNKAAPGFLSEDLFNKYLQQVDPKLASDLLIDRESRNAIINGKAFDRRHFKKICDLDTVQVFAAE